MAEIKFNKIWSVLTNYNFIINEDISEDVLCKICKKIIIDPYCASCGCRYCSNCIKTYIGNEKKHCPDPKEECLEEFLEFEKNVLKDLATRRNILNMMIKCPNESCVFKTKLSNIEDHIHICVMKPIVCPYEILGCENKEVRKCNVKDHLDFNVLKHSKLLVKTINALKTDMNKLREIVETKVEEINELKEETKRNKTEIEIMKEDYQKKETLMREEIDEMKKEIKILKDKEVKIKGEIDAEKENITEKHNEEVINVKKDLKRHKEGTKNRIKKELNLDIINDFVWTIKYFTEKSKNNGEEFFSDSFYKDDYKLCLRAQIFGIFSCADLYLSVIIMKGERDEVVQWPMKHTITVSIINQDSQKTHKCWTLNYDDCEDKSLFMKPKTDTNGHIDCGYISLFDFKDIQGLVKGDSVTVGCSLSYK